EQLLVILAAKQDAPLPTAVTATFWRDCAQRLHDRPALIFDLFNEPSALNLSGDRWRAWQSAMQASVDAIRSTGATQLVAAASFQDSFEFQGFTTASAIRDASVIYEVHPFFDHGLTDEARNTNFGFMTANYPVYA